MGTVNRAALAAVLAGLVSACQSKTPAPSTTRDAFAEALPVASLQVAPATLVQLEITQPGREPVTLRVSDEQWDIVSPLSYPAKAPSVESMLAVLAEIQIVRRVAAQPEPRHRLGPDGRVLVKAWTRDGAELAFAVGASKREETFVQRVGEEQVFAALGACRRFFDLSLEQLRAPAITNFEVATIEAVRFTNEWGTLDIVPSADDARRFVEASPSIPNFNSERASKNVAVLATLFAKGFVDPPIDAPATGLFLEDTPRAQVSFRGKKEPLIVFIGARTTHGRLHLRTSASEQIYLVSAHLGSSLMPRDEHFARTDSEMRVPQDDREAQNASTTPGDHAREHKHGSVRPTQVSSELMGELRALAREQRK